ncbi:hypothetical protein [Thioalkalivibrio sp. ALJ24]|uniref:hypothetical protein n=1 Tax=Thioalkalivibrio sp. ALJ24 TaxID=545276 RepID=UPI00037591B9|nr:hypothetical protein [Thioalkalivibrio sp. ALJ24]
MNKEDLFQAFQDAFASRKFVAGLLVAYIDMFRDIGVPDLGASTLQDVMVVYPRREITARGARANTLILQLPDGQTKSLRPYYNKAERLFRSEHKRFDYPSCAPHATQAWSAYQDWLDALATFSDAELIELRDRVIAYVLEKLPSHAFDPTSISVDPPLLRLLLERFEMKSQKGEPTGAAFQGIVFGFLRADNPHLQIEIDKVRTGSKRLQRVGDIDGWEGGRLALSAEVKQYVYPVDGVPDLMGFANECGLRGAIGLVVTLGFEDGARAAIENLGVKALDTGDLLQIVELWDPLKQRTAVNSLIYYAQHVEKNSSLSGRIESFLEEVSDDSEEP